MLSHDEARIVENAKRSPEKFAQLYEHYVDRIFAYAYLRTGDRTVSEDITASVFQKALGKVHTFRWKGISYGAYLFRIARSEIADYLKESRRWVDMPDSLPHDPGLEQIVQQHEELQALAAALNQLSQQDQDIIRMRFLMELSSAEVAEMLGCSVDNVYLRLHRALQRLRKELDSSQNVFWALRRKNNVTS